MASLRLVGTRSPILLKSCEDGVLSSRLAWQVANSHRGPRAIPDAAFSRFLDPGLVAGEDPGQGLRRYLTSGRGVDEAFGPVPAADRSRDEIERLHATLRSLPLESGPVGDQRCHLVVICREPFLRRTVSRNPARSSSPSHTSALSQSSMAVTAPLRHASYPSTR